MVAVIIITETKTSLIILIGITQLTELIAQRNHRDIPALQLDLEGAIAVYDAVRQGSSYSRARKSLPGASANTLMRDIGAIAAMFQDNRAFV